MSDTVDEAHRAHNENEQLSKSKQEQIQLLILHLCDNIILCCEEFSHYEFEVLKGAIISNVKAIKYILEV